MTILEDYADAKLRYLGKPFLLLDSDCHLILLETSMFDVSEAARTEFVKIARQLEAEAAEMKPNEYNPESAIALRAFKDTVGVDIYDLSRTDWFALGFISKDDNPLFGIEESFRWAIIEEYAGDHLHRLQLATAQIPVVIENLRTAMNLKVALNRETVERFIGFCKEFPESQATQSTMCVPPYSQSDEFVSINLVEEKVVFSEALQLLNGGFQRLAVFLQDIYLPHSRPNPGIYQLPGYEKAYQEYIRQYCLSDETPDEIHAIGISEIDRIRGEMLSIMKTLGQGGDIQAFSHNLRDRQAFPDLFEADGDTAFEKFDSIITAAFEASKHFTFTSLRAYKYAIQATTRVAVENENSAPLVQFKNTPNAFQSLRSFEVNVKKLLELPNHQWEAIILNQIYPGAYHQMETMNDRGQFFKTEHKLSKSQAWPHYAESCGTELGFYTSPFQLFGKLERELLNSIMLVVDTGLHARGWTIDQSVKYIQETAAYITPEDALELVLSACEAPGKALGPKIGELRIKKLREKVAEEFPVKDLVLMGFNHTALETEFYKGGRVMEYAMEFRMKDWRYKREN
ncbi:hypothetical protein BDR26DRAFT_876404 [Obelidium mucronatum]|nr:hypothetical protein BDR26DRAFT_876404 [Obelidium mucronatum]